MEKHKNRREERKKEKCRSAVEKSFCRRRKQE